MSAAAVLQTLHSSIQDLEASRGARAVEGFRMAARDVDALVEALWAMRTRVTEAAEIQAQNTAAALIAREEQLVALRAEVAVARGELHVASALDGLLRDILFRYNGKHLDIIDGVPALMSSR